eukprot:TRINITY_DN22303_c0_g1_i1.p1 TRINITY_DN22303_c0_g1~~TRINITY_DN22303_c0_g1_i1.p1  ORF type:complete len:124 (-),score=21.96 TRINITY_DN22303_c0_g1_i1:70-441(-)
MTETPKDAIVYRLAVRSDWEEAQKIGKYIGTQVDFDSGFLHLSTAATCRKTGQLYYKDVDNVVLLAVELSKVKDRVQWDPAKGRDNVLFPHIYGVLNTDAIINVYPLSRDAQGEFVYPEGLGI